MKKFVVFFEKSTSCRLIESKYFAVRFRLPLHNILKFLDDFENMGPENINNNNP